MKFKIIEVVGLEDFTIEVNKLLDDGWVLRGYTDTFKAWDEYAKELKVYTQTLTKSN